MAPEPLDVDVQGLGPDLAGIGDVDEARAGPSSDLYLRVHPQHQGDQNMRTIRRLSRKLYRHSDHEIKHDVRRLSRKLYRHSDQVIKHDIRVLGAA